MKQQTIKKWLYLCFIALSILPTQQLLAQTSVLLQGDDNLAITNLTSGIKCSYDIDDPYPSSEHQCNGVIACIGDVIRITYEDHNGVPNSYSLTVSINGAPAVTVTPGGHYDITTTAVGTITLQPITTGNLIAGTYGALYPTYITVVSNTPAFSPGPGSTVCLGQNICFQSLNNPNFNYSFSSSTGVQNINFPNCFTFNTPGTNYITYTLNAGHTCSATVTSSISVVPSALNITPNGSCNLWQYFNASYSCATFTNATYYWSFDNGTTVSTINNNSHWLAYFPSAGIYTVTCTLVDNATGNYYTASQVVSIGLLPSLTITTNTANICNAITNFTATPSPSGSYTYSWSVQDAATNATIPMPAGSTGTNTAIAAINFANINQNVNVCATITNSLGCKATQCYFITSCCQTPTTVVKYTNKTFTFNTTISTPSVSFGGTITINSGVTLILQNTNAQLEV